MWNRLSGCRSLIARSTRRFTAAPEAAERSYIKAYWETGAHGPELYVLTAYCTLCTGFMLYNLLISHGSRNEFSHFPFMNKDQLLMMHADVTHPEKCGVPARWLSCLLPHA